MSVLLGVAHGSRDAGAQRWSPSCWRWPPRLRPGLRRGGCLRRQRLALDPGSRRGPGRRRAPRHHRRTAAAERRLALEDRRGRLRPAGAARPPWRRASATAGRSARTRWSSGSSPLGWPRRERPTLPGRAGRRAVRATPTPTPAWPRPRGCCGRAGRSPRSTSPSCRRRGLPSYRRWSGCRRRGIGRSRCRGSSSGRGTCRSRSWRRPRRPVLEVVVTEPLGATPSWPGLVLARYDEAIGGDIRMNCDACLYRVRAAGQGGRRRRSAAAAQPPGRHLGKQKGPEPQAPRALLYFDRRRTAS